MCHCRPMLNVVAVQLNSMCDPCTQKIMKAFLRMFLVMFDEDGDAGSLQTAVTGVFDMTCAKDNEVFPAHHALCLCVHTRTHISTSTHAPHTHIVVHDHVCELDACARDYSNLNVINVQWIRLCCGR